MITEVRLERKTGSPGLNLCPCIRELNGSEEASWSLEQVSPSLWVSAASYENEMAQRIYKVTSS